MAYEYGGRYYATLASQRNAMARDKYTPQQMQIAKTIAYQQLPSHLKGRGSQMRVQQNLASTAEALFGGQQRQQAAPAPAPAPSAPAPSPAAPAQSEAVAKLTAESQAYRKEAEEKLSAADLRIKELEDEELKAQRAKELQQRLSIISASNLARSSMAPKLQIAPATNMPMIGGTAQFKRRSQSMFKAPASNTLNI